MATQSERRKKEKSEEEKILELEGLPEDFHRIKNKLELYFKNKRTGGEILEIQEHPEDQRKAWLIYEDEEDLKKVLETRVHRVVFKGLGLVDMTVKRLEDSFIKKTPPPLLPKPKLSQSAQAAEVKEEPVSEMNKANEGISSKQDLLVSTTVFIEKESLEIYFEQFTVKAELTKHGKNRWILKVDSQSDVEKILAQQEYYFGLSVEVYKERKVSEFCDPRRFILTSCSGDYKCKDLEMFISSCCQKAEHSWELVDEDSIVVTFKEDIDVKSFLTKCTTKKWKNIDIGASQLELTDSVLVQGDMSRVKEEILKLYFSNARRSGGGDIKHTLWVNKLESVVITFKDCHVAQHVVEQKHRISDTDLSAMLFYPSLQIALTGKTPDSSEICTKINIPLCMEILEFLEKNAQHKNDFQDHLKKVHAKAIFDKTASPNEIKLEMDVDTESLAVLHLGAAWEGSARREASAFLTKYTMAELVAEDELWKRIKEDCRQLIGFDVNISFEESKGKIVIAGLKEMVSALSNKIQDLLQEATAELEVERNTVERAIQLDSKEIFELVAKQVHSHLSTKVVSPDESTLTFHLKGLKDDVSAAEKVINLAKYRIVVHDLTLSAHLLRFLKSLDLKKFVQDHFAPSQIPAYFRRDGDHLTMLVETENISKAEDKLEELLKEEVVRVTSAVKTSDSWLNFLKTLEAEVKLSRNAHSVSITSAEKDIVICGFAQVVAHLSRKVRDYLENKTSETVNIQLKSLRELEYVNSCMNLSGVPEIRDIGATILACRTEVSPCLKVTAAKENIQDAKTMVNKHVSSIVVDTLVYAKAGESKVIHKHEANVKAKAKEFNCQAYLSIEKAATTGPTKCYNHKISNCLSLTIANGDLLWHSAEAFVCPMNSKLDFDHLVAQKFLQVAGPQIQTIYSKVQKEKQSLLAGDTVISETGLLNAKTLIYAVLPQRDQSLSACYMESAIYDSLLKAETSKSASIAMPVIGSGPFGFSVKDSCMAIRKAILKFSNSNQHSPSNLKDILVVDSDPDIMEEFNTLISELGFPDLPTSTRLTSTTSASPSIPVKPKPGSNTEVVINGVLVSLKKGDITKETVDVIVNSSNSALDLNTGVSGAILAAAGQSVVDECKKHGPQKPDGVVLTSGGNLSCKHIAQMVGSNNAADITFSIEKVLKLCEGQMAATVAIPAIGTGRGGITATDSIKAIITGLKNHLTQVQPSDLKEITVVAFEQKIYDSYCDYFKKWNKPSAKASQTAHTKMPYNQVKIGGVRIEVKKGSITNETVRGIVNTTNNQMNLTTGVSGAIFKAAGPSVQQECQNHGPLKSDTVAVTKGGNLQCDHIIHMMGPNSAADAQLRVKKVLEKCEKKQISTVSFPAVGTGRGGVKGPEAITAMLQGFKDHLSQRRSTAIKLIYVVIDRDQVLNEFLQGLKQWASKTQVETQDSDEESEWSDYNGDSDEMEDLESLEEEEEEDNISETSIGRIRVKVICGDITKDTTEAIVSSTNTSLNLSSGVSGAILKAAGQTVVDECKKLGTQAGDGVVLTKAGNLPFNNIVHMVGQNNEKEISRCMYNVLKKCEENKIQSVSFPALGTGVGNLAAAQVAMAMLKSVANFAVESPTFLKTIHIVIFQAKMLPDFEDALKTFKKTSPKASPVSKPKPVKQTLPLSKPSKIPVFPPITFPIMKIQVYGTSRADLAKVKTFLDNLVTEECITKDVPSEHLPSLPETDKEAIVALSQSNEVQVHVAAVDKLTVSGKKDDVYDAVMKIDKFLQAVKERKLLIIEEKRLSETLRWEVADQEKWVPLDSSISYKLELAFYRKEKNCTYQDKRDTYTVDFKDLKRVNSKGQSSRVKRTLLGDAETAIIHPPPKWTKMGGKDLEMVKLSKSDEYKNIERDFLKSSKHQEVAPVQVVEIHRIQNKGLWQRYCVLKQEVDKKYPKQTNEQFLYHGTTNQICQKINKNGFNRSFCGRNAVVHGEGTYFAKEAWYSCQDQYSNPDQNGLKYIYRARVVTGSPCKSRQGMKEPDPLNPKDPRAGLHNCAVDDLQNPFIFVVFCDAGAYPDYLITFKNV